LYGEELADTDGSEFKSVDSKDWSHTEAKLRERIECLEVKIEAYLAELGAADTGYRGRHGGGDGHACGESEL
jgi:hypothetical protein